MLYCRVKAADYIAICLIMHLPADSRPSDESGREFGSNILGTRVNDGVTVFDGTQILDSLYMLMPLAFHP